MSLFGITTGTDNPADDPEVMERTRQLAGEIARDANRTSARIGITYEDLPDGSGVRIGPRGAPAIAVEIGTAQLPARRPVKRALDRRRLA